MRNLSKKKLHEFLYSQIKSLKSELKRARQGRETFKRLLKELQRKVKEKRNET